MVVDVEHNVPLNKYRTNSPYLLKHLLPKRKSILKQVPFIKHFSILSLKSKQLSLKKSVLSICWEKLKKFLWTHWRAASIKKYRLWEVLEVKSKRYLCIWKMWKKVNCQQTIKSCFYCNKSSTFFLIWTQKTLSEASQLKIMTWCLLSTSARWLDVFWLYTLWSLWVKTTKRKRRICNSRDRSRKKKSKKRKNDYRWISCSITIFIGIEACYIIDWG